VITVVQVILDRLVSTKPASGIAFCTAFTHETINQTIRVFTFEYEAGVDDVAVVLEGIAEASGYQVAGLY
jgi:hypothetical protein